MKLSIFFEYTNHRLIQIIIFYLLVKQVISHKMTFLLSIQQYVVSAQFWA